MSDVKFNINDRVRVKLTPTGLAHYRKLWGREPLLNEHGEYCNQLWALMETFGSAIYLGCEPPFETEIILEVPGPVTNA